MFCFGLDVSHLKRNSEFPFRIWRIFFSPKARLASNLPPMRNNYLEICLRLESEAEICNDIVNGETVHVPYPNAVWKLPMQEFAPRDNANRYALALLYRAEDLDLFRKTGLIPKMNCLPLIMNAEISSLQEKIIRTLSNLYSPSAADRLDWLGFSLIKEVLLSSGNHPQKQTMEQKIKNISVYLNSHCSENPDFHLLARQHGLNYSQFYREWSRYIGITPLQFIIQARLEAAASLLERTSMPISQIVEAVHFSGTYAFYSRFRKKYGMTPDQFRKSRTGK
ncbi:MAG: helix-turn-helix transcriptional regulator [Lentisphaeria bacterium]|nr:helix-turn-helix transcriptional regulator [Lentisphaeria bacterium]